MPERQRQSEEFRVSLSVSHHFRQKECIAPPRTKADNKWALAYDWQAVTWTPEQIIDHQTRGGAICVSKLKAHHRKESEVESVQLMLLDFDFGPSVSELEAHPFISEHAFFITATASSTTHDPHSRVAFALDEPIVDVRLFQPHLLRLMELVEQSGLKPDRACKDASRMFYGSCNPDYIAHPENRLPIAVLNALPPSQIEVAKARRADHKIKGAQTMNGNEAYAQKAFQDEIVLLRSTTENRNNQLNKSAFALGQFVGAGCLNRHTVESALLEAALYIGLGEEEIHDTIRSGTEAGMAEPRDVPKSQSANKHSNHTGKDRRNDPSARTEQPIPSSPNGKSHRYEGRDGQMYYITTQMTKADFIVQEHLIADFDLHIAETLRTESGEEVYRIKGKTKYDKALSFEISAEEFTETRKLRAKAEAAAGARCAVAVRMTEHLGPAIKQLTETEHYIPVFNRTGWDGEKFLLPGRELEGAKISLPMKLRYAIASNAELGKGLEALEAIIKAMPPSVSMPALMFLFQAPLARLAGWRNERYTLAILGRTGSLKTTWTQTGMSIYGPDFIRDDLLLKWGDGSTSNSIMAMAATAHDMPFLIDNYKPNTGRGSKDFVGLIHNISEGGEKDRLDRNANLRDSRPVYCWPLVTCEDLPSDDPATLARMLIVQFPWQRGEQNPELAKAQTLSPHLSAVGEAWIAWLEGDLAKVFVAQANAGFEEIRQQYANHLRTLNPNMPNILRLATHLSTNSLTGWIIRRHPSIGPVIKQHKKDHEKGLLSIASEMARMTSSALPAQRIIEAIQQVLASGSGILLPLPVDNVDERDRGRVIGYESQNEFNLLFDVARKKVEELIGAEALGGASNTTLYKQMDELGYLARKGTETKTVALNVHGKTVRTLCLKKEVLTPPSP